MKPKTKSPMRSGLDPKDLAKQSISATRALKKRMDDVLKNGLQSPSDWHKALSVFADIAFPQIVQGLRNKNPRVRLEYLKLYLYYALDFPSKLAIDAGMADTVMQLNRAKLEEILRARTLDGKMEILQEAQEEAGGGQDVPKAESKTGVPFRGRAEENTHPHTDHKQ